MTNIEELLLSALDCGVDYLLPGVLYLRGKSRTDFFSFLDREYPELVENYQFLYQKGGANRGYKDKLYREINILRDKHQVPKSYMKPMREKLNRGEINQCL